MIRRLLGLRILLGLSVLAALLAGALLQKEAPNAAKAAEKDTTTLLFTLEIEKLSGKGKLPKEKSSFVLSPGDFRVIEDGGAGKVEQEVVAIGDPEGAKSLVLLVEGWGMGRQSYYDPLLDAIINSTEAFLHELGENDYVSLVTFDMHPRVVVDFKKTDEAANEIRAELISIYRSGGTGFREANVYDAIAFTLDALEGQPGHKFIVLITKGRDTFSKLTLDGMRERIAASRDVTLYIICISDILMQWGYEAPFDVRANMQSLAAEGGGEAFFPRFEGAFRGFAGDVINAMRAQKTLTYRAKPVPVKGKHPKIKIRVECNADVDGDGKPDKFRIRHKLARLPNE